MAPGGCSAAWLPRASAALLRCCSTALIISHESHCRDTATDRVRTVCVCVQEYERKLHIVYLANDILFKGCAGACGHGWHASPALHDACVCYCVCVRTCVHCCVCLCVRACACVYVSAAYTPARHLLVFVQASGARGGPASHC